MSKKKVLVTGATGFVGGYVINELLRHNCEVVITSTSMEKARQFKWFEKVRFIPFDLRNISSDINYHSFFDRPDSLIHLAWEDLPNYKDEFHVKENLPRHHSFLKNMVENGLKDLTVTGTCFEYGMQEGCLSEDLPAKPSNFYAAAKNELRITLTDLSKIHPFILKWPRLFYMYGRGQNPNSLLSQFQSAIDRGDKIFNMSPGDQLRDYLPVEVMAEYIVKIALQTKITGIINCCSGKPVAVKDMVESYLKTQNAFITLNLGHYPYSDIEPKNFWGDTKKLKLIIDE